MDESGNLGNYGEEGNSKYFFVTFFITKDGKLSELILKKTFKWMKKKGIKNKGGTFHANKELPASITKLLEFTQGKDFIIATYYINKKSVGWMSKDIHLLYNNLVRKLLLLCLDRNILLRGDSVVFYAARRETNRYLNEQFENHILKSCEGLLNLKFRLRFPMQEKGLQLVDAVSYSIYHKFELNNSEWYDSFKEKIKIEEEYKGKGI